MLDDSVVQFKIPSLYTKKFRLKVRCLKWATSVHTNRDYENEGGFLVLLIFCRLIA